MRRYYVWKEKDELVMCFYDQMSSQEGNVFHPTKEEACLAYQEQLDERLKEHKQKGEAIQLDQFKLHELMRDLLHELMRDLS